MKHLQKGILAICVVLLVSFAVVRADHRGGLNSDDTQHANWIFPRLGEFYERVGIPGFTVPSYTNITVAQAWTFLNTTADGIQIPIDVRRDDEWRLEHIDTPSPEDPVHFPLADLQTPQGLQEFISLFDGQQVLIYCRSGSRSTLASEIISGSSFTGVIYNMTGGINAWKTAGHAVEPNNAPLTPSISGASGVGVGITYNLLADSTDPDGEDVYYRVDWGNGNISGWLGPYDSGTVVSLSHTWFVPGEYEVKAKSRDRYLDESEWSDLRTVRVMGEPARFRPHL